MLDTLASVKPIRTQQGYTEDYESLAALHRLANETGVSIILLHHTRKMEAEDPVDTVSGTLGLSGCADSILVLNRTSQGTTLYVRGRDIEEAEHAVSFDKANAAGPYWAMPAMCIGRMNAVPFWPCLMKQRSQWGHPISRLPLARPSTTPSSCCTRWPRLAKSRNKGAGNTSHPRHVKTATPGNFDNAVTNG